MTSGDVTRFEDFAPGELRSNELPVEADAGNQGRILLQKHVQLAVGALELIAETEQIAQQQPRVDVAGAAFTPCRAASIASSSLASR